MGIGKKSDEDVNDILGAPLRPAKRLMLCKTRPRNSNYTKPQKITGV